METTASVKCALPVPALRHRTEVRGFHEGAHADAAGPDHANGFRAVL